MSKAWTKAQVAGGFFETCPEEEDLEDGLLKGVSVCVLMGCSNVFNMPRDHLGEKSTMHWNEL